jgi:hypothetical protein
MEIDFLQQVEHSRWNQMGSAMQVQTEPVECYGVLLGKHGPSDPERFQEMVLESYEQWVQAYQKAMVFPDVPEWLVETAHAVYGSMVVTVESIPEGTTLSFAKLVEVHDVLATRFARFSIAGKALKQERKL